MKTCSILSLFLMTSFVLAGESWVIDSQVDWEISSLRKRGFFAKPKGITGGLN